MTLLHVTSLKLRVFLFFGFYTRGIKNKGVTIMVEYIKNIKSHLVWLFLFGLGGLLLELIVKAIVRLMNAFPKTCLLIIIVLLVIEKAINPSLKKMGGSLSCFSFRIL